MATIMGERETKGRHLFSLNGRVTESTKPCGMRRKEQVTIAKMRIGHTLLNSTLFIIGKHQDGMCDDERQQPETVPHVLIHCRRYSRERKELLETLRE